MPQKQSNSPSSEARPSKVATSLPMSLLQQLEPGVEGEWKITSQSQKSFTLSFIMKQGSEAVHYCISPCMTKAEVERECADFIYEYSPVLDRSSHKDGTEHVCALVKQPTREPSTFSVVTTSPSQHPGDPEVPEASWVSDQSSYAHHHVTETSTAGFMPSPMGVPGSSYSVESPMTPSPAFQGFAMPASASQSTSWQVDNSMVGLCYDGNAMLSPTMPASVATASDFAVAWDPLVGFEGEVVKSGLERETQLGWNMMQGQE